MFSNLATLRKSKRRNVNFINSDLSSSSSSSLFREEFKIDLPSGKTHALNVR